MQNIPIQAITNQTLSVVLENATWDITLKYTNGVMVASFSVNGADVIDNLIATAGSFIIPSEYEESGNFIFTTMNNELPNYLQFGTTQNLVYVSEAELVVFRAPFKLPITAADFNPLGALPLRFSPQGYT